MSTEGGSEPSWFKNIIKALPEGTDANVEGNETRDSEDEEPKKREMIGRADQIFNKQKRRFEYFKSANRKSRKFRFTKYVILVRTIWSARGVPAQEEIDIKGSLLQQALIDINEDTEGFTLDRGSPTIDRRILFHSTEGIQQALNKELASDDPDKNLIFELRAGLQFIREEFEKDVSTLAELLSKRLITFNLLWMIFPPNTIVVGQDEFKQPRAYRSRMVEESDKGVLIFTIDYLDYNGEDLGVISGTQKNVAPFNGSRSLDSLPFIPLNLHFNPNALKSTLLANGREAMKLHCRRLVEYKGYALREGKERFVKFNSHGRIMLDPKTLEQTMPWNNLVPDDLNPVNLKTLSDEQIMTVAPQLYGFSLGDKTWGIFAVSQVSDVNWDNGIFEALVLEQERKNLIHDLVQTHKSAEAAFDDFVRLKGKGLVGLLAGPPGVGKTMTAEAIAEIVKRPLYTISSGELGEEVSEIHDKLKSILEVAELWDAVLLLDEADVFLAKRSDTDIARNAIASIFLRELEYYQGIIILTTNRLQSFDSAFQSRIHFCLDCPELSSDGRESIWRGFIARAKQNPKLAVEISDDDFHRLGELSLNGRQIKNVMSVSQRVATKRGQPLTLARIKADIELCQGFFLKQDLR